MKNEEIKKNSNITFDELEKKLGKSRRTIIHQVEKLKEKGFIEKNWTRQRRLLGSDWKMKEMKDNLEDVGYGLPKN